MPNMFAERFSPGGVAVESAKAASAASEPVQNNHLNKLHETWSTRLNGGSHLRFGVPFSRDCIGPCRAVSGAADSDGQGLYPTSGGTNRHGAESHGSSTAALP